MDSDGLVMKKMDHLFQLPAAPVAMTRAYWLDQPYYNTQLLVIQPDLSTFEALVATSKQLGGFDMDVLNFMYNSTCLTLPNEYNIVTGEFKRKEHSRFLGNGHGGSWDPEKAVSEAYYVHFSDWPVRKPWLNSRGEELEEGAPDCPYGCAEREIWLRLYRTFQNELQQIVDDVAVEVVAR